MTRTITDRDLQDLSAEILDGLGRGESYIVMRDGLPVGELTPYTPRTFVPAEVVKAAFAGLPPIDAKKFREDIDTVLDQDPTPRA